MRWKSKEYGMKKNEILKILVVVWGIILPKGKSKLKECQALYNQK